MDIISSLATLSFDKRRSEFFTKELLILLKLVDKKIIIKKIFYLDLGLVHLEIFNLCLEQLEIMQLIIIIIKLIELKKTEDSFASAANYLKKLVGKKSTMFF